MKGQLKALVEEAVELLGAERVPADVAPRGVVLWEVKDAPGFWQTNTLVAEAFNRIGKDLV